jgi:hypothetical protein
MLARTNAEAPWSDFSSDRYFRHNYASLLPEDREIIKRVGEFFVRAFSKRAGPVQRAIDVGSGTNLYPALLMLPWAERILLTDYSPNNVDWLCDHVASDEEPWDWAPFWRQLSALPGYSQVDQPRRLLRAACRSEPGLPGLPGIQQCNIFELPPRQWQLGTMFFVAESITTVPKEFREAVRCFIGALEPDAPFAAAFMAGSVKYEVEGVDFPSTPVTLKDVTACLAAHASDLQVELIDEEPGVREGYDGMIVATGFARG